MRNIFPNELLTFLKDNIDSRDFVRYQKAIKAIPDRVVRLTIKDLSQIVDKKIDIIKVVLGLKLQSDGEYVQWISDIAYGILKRMVIEVPHNAVNQSFYDYISGKEYNPKDRNHFEKLCSQLSTAYFASIPMITTIHLSSTGELSRFEAYQRIEIIGVQNLMANQIYVDTDTDFLRDIRKFAVSTFIIAN